MQLSTAAWRSFTWDFKTNEKFLLSPAGIFANFII